MKDRIAELPNRRLITPEDGGAPFYARITRADNPIEQGTPLNKQTLLSDDTAALYGLSGDGATVSNALALAASMGGGGSEVFMESASTTTTARVAAIEDIESWNDVINKPLFIRAAANGVSSVTTLNINGLGAKTLYFPNMSGAGTVTTPLYYWVRTGQVYTVVWDGTYCTVLNTQVMAASTSYPGIVQLSSSYTSTSATMAPTLTALNNVYNSIPTAASGNWTPALRAADTAGTASYSDRIGWYAKVGRVVSFGLYLNASLSGGTGSLQITGLPFAAYNTNVIIPARIVSNAWNSYEPSQIGYLSTANGTNIFRVTPDAGSGTASSLGTHTIYVQTSGTYISVS